MASETTESIKDAFSFISERGVLGGMYLGILMFGLFTGSNQIGNLSINLLWLLGICLVSGIIITSITNELLMPIFRWATSPIALWAFNKTAREGSVAELPNYKKVREFREIFRATEGSEHLKARIAEEEKLRQTTTYFTTSSIIALVAIYWLDRLLNIQDTVVKIESYTVWYVLIATLLGQVFRSFSFGRAVGFAYIKIKARPLAD